ncbi:MAG TPA: nucleotidyltransferase domain-containing protein, partial [Longimicrobiaceae bacterium]
LQRETGLGIRSLQVELSRLVRMGLVQRTEDGKLVRYSAIESHPAWPAVRALIRSFVDLPEILRSALSPIDGIMMAFVFGSYARGTSTPESDVDLFVVAEDVPRAELAQNTMEASMLLGREVNPVVYSPAELSERTRSGSRFVDEVLHGPKSWVIGSDRLLEVG